VRAAPEAGVDESTSNSSTLPVAQVITSYAPEFTVVAGDLSYASGGVLLPAGGGNQPQPTYAPSDWDSYFNIFGLNAAQSIPWLIGVGNHEMEPLTQDGYAGVLTRFPRPYDTTSGSPVVSTFVHGNVAFIQLDANDLSAEISPNNGYTAGTQTTWLKNKLAAYRAANSGVDFIVVAFHNCMYCSNTTHGSDGGVRNVWESIFETYNVDLVLKGHVHAYERTYPILNGQPNTASGASGAPVYPATQGTTYICAGNGGQSLYTGWYGPTGGGDPATAAGAPHINEFAGTPSPNGAATDGVDSVTGYSVYRTAIWGFIVVDVTAPSTQGGTTTMYIRAIDPTQPQPPASDTGISSVTSPAIIDSVTLSRTSRVNLGPSSALPEFAEPAALLVAGAGVLAGGAYLASRRSGGEAQPA